MRKKMLGILLCFIFLISGCTEETYEPKYSYDSNGEIVYTWVEYKNVGDAPRTAKSWANDMKITVWDAHTSGGNFNKSDKFNLEKLIVHTSGDYYNEIYCEYSIKGIKTDEMFSVFVHNGGYRDLVWEDADKFKPQM